MKTLIALIGLLIFTIFNNSTQAQTTTADSAQSISNILIERLHVRLNSMRIVIDDGRLVSVQLHQVRYVKLLEQIDTTGCPQDFRMAWLEYVQVWQRKTDIRNAVITLTEGVSLFQGNLTALGDIAKRSEANDTLIPWQKCEQAALEYGVDASRVKLH